MAVNPYKWAEVYKLATRKFGPQGKRKLFHWEIVPDGERCWIVKCTVFALGGQYALDRFITADALDLILLSGNQLVDKFRDDLGEALVNYGH